MSNYEKSLIVLLLVTLLPLTTVVSAPFLGPVTPMAARAVSTRALGTFTETFTTTTYSDSGNTDAAGWGTGVVTSPRIGGITLLDHYTTSTPVRAVDVQGRKAYIGQWQALAGPTAMTILNITDPTDMVAMGTRGAPAHLFDLQVEGDMLFAGADSLGGIPDGAGDTWIYNVSNPYGNPPIIDNFASMEGLSTGMDVQGRFYYLTSYEASADHGLYIFDVEDPGAIKHISNSLVFSELLDVDVEGQLAYLAEGTLGFYIVNVSNPYAPITVGSVNTPGNASGVLIEGDLAYVADGGSGVQIIDISNPTSPVILGSYNTPGNAYRLALQGDTLYVADGTGGLIVLDVADPANPCLVDSYALSYAWDVALYGGVVVVGSGNGVYSFQVGSMDSLTFVGSYDDYDAWDVRVRGDIAYVAAGPDGLLTLDISNPTNPVLLDRYNTGILGYYRKLDVQGHLAFVLDYGTPGRWNTFDVSDPTNIKRIWDGSGTELSDVYAWGDIVVYTWDTGIGFMNISNPYSPSINTISVGTNITACWVQGYHLYIVEDLGGSGPCFHIYDITDISNPVQVGSMGTSAYFYDVFVDGDVSYTADTNWVILVNVTDPTGPFFHPWGWTEDLVNATYGVWGFGPYIIDAHSTNGVNLIDASYINGPDILSNYPGATGALQVTVHGDYAYVANRSSLVILRLFQSIGATYSTGTFAAQSTAITTSAYAFSNATLLVSHYIPSGTSANYFLSADGGLHWESVTPGVSHTFTYPGLDLRWKANFTSAYNDRSVHIYEVSIAYDKYPPAPFPIAIIIAVVVIIIVILVLLLLYFLWYKKKGK